MKKISSRFDNHNNFFFKFVFKNTLFDIKLIRNLNNEDLFDWLRWNNEWVRMPGYNAMLYSFKCKPWPTTDEIGPDPTDWIGEEEKVGN